jgi:hypothetical protein
LLFLSQLSQNDFSALLRPSLFSLAVEFQAIDRVHRIGQTRPVHIYRFVMENSLEQRMHNVQRSKTALGNGSLRKLTPEERKLARITALKGT